MYDAYTDYSRKVLNIPVIPNYPKVSWKAGNHSNGVGGVWVIDGREYPGTVDQVEAHFKERTDYWIEKVKHSQ